MVRPLSIVTLSVVAAICSVLSLLVPIHPYSWDVGSGLALQRDADTAAAIVWLGIVGLVVASVAEGLASTGPVGASSKFLRVGRTIVAIVLVWRIASAWSGYTG